MWMAAWLDWHVVVQVAFVSLTAAGTCTLVRAAHDAARPRYASVAVIDAWTAIGLCETVLVGTLEGNISSSSGLSHTLKWCKLSPPSFRLLQARSGICCVQQLCGAAAAALCQIMLAGLQGHW